MRPIRSIIEFKQIVGRGTRLYDGKDYFTIYDFVKAHHHFSDPEWDGETLAPEPCAACGQLPCICIPELCRSAASYRASVPPSSVPAAACGPSVLASAPGNRPSSTSCWPITSASGSGNWTRRS